MSRKTISTKKDLKKFFGNTIEKKLLKAISFYLEMGGVLRVAFKKVKNKEKLVIVYPTKKTLDLKIKEKQKMLNVLKSEESEWVKRLRQAEFYEITSNLKKFSQPLYWKHLAKYYLDKDYRHDADLVGLPTYLVSDKRWRQLVEMFVSNPDYRKQLTEAIQTSIAYSEDRRVARFARKQQEFRKSECKRKLLDLTNKIKKVSSELQNYYFLKNIL